MRVASLDTLDTRRGTWFAAFFAHSSPRLIASPRWLSLPLSPSLSPPQALSQCDNYLRAAGISPCAAYDTAGSAKLVKEGGLRDTCAIASMHAAKVHGLDVLDFGIEDDANNFTRFLILGRKPCRPPSPAASKTSIVFVPRRDEAGSLFKALSVFAVRDINLSKVESRPHRPGVPWAVAEDDLATPSSNRRGIPPQHAEADETTAAPKGGPAVASFEYAFYVDLLAGTDEDRVQNAIRHLKEISGAVRVLGCYPLGGVYLEKAEATAPGTPKRTGGQSTGGELVTPGSRSMPLKVAILGFGTFGQFLAKRWLQRGHSVLAYSRSDYREIAEAMGAQYFNDTGALISAHPDVIVLAVSILSFATVLGRLPTELFKGALVVDVLSVKVHDPPFPHISGGRFPHMSELISFLHRRDGAHLEHELGALAEEGGLLALLLAEPLGHLLPLLREPVVLADGGGGVLGHAAVLVLHRPYGSGGWRSELLDGVERLALLLRRRAQQTHQLPTLAHHRLAIVRLGAPPLHHVLVHVAEGVRGRGGAGGGGGLLECTQIRPPVHRARRSRHDDEGGEEHGSHGGRV